MTEEEKESYLTDDKGAEFILNRQLETYWNIQNQTISLLRTLIASLALIAVLMSTVGFSNVSKSVSQYNITRSFQESSENIGGSTNELATYAILNIEAGILLVVAGGFLFTLSIFQLGMVLLSRDILPVTAEIDYSVVSGPWSVEKIGLEDKEIDLDQVKEEWLNKNREAIVRMKSSLRFAQRSLVYSIILTIFGLLMTLSGYFGQVQILGYMNILVVSIVGSILLIRLWFVFQSIRRNGLEALREMLPQNMSQQMSENISFIIIVSGFVFFAVSLMTYGVIFWIRKIGRIPFLQI